MPYNIPNKPEEKLSSYTSGLATFKRDKSSSTVMKPGQISNIVKQPSTIFLKERNAMKSTTERHSDLIYADPK